MVQELLKKLIFRLEKINILLLKNKFVMFGLQCSPKNVHNQMSRKLNQLRDLESVEQIKANIELLKRQSTIL